MVLVAEVALEAAALEIQQVEMVQPDKETMAVMEILIVVKVAVAAEAEQAQ